MYAEGKQKLYHLLPKLQALGRAFLEKLRALPLNHELGGAEHQWLVHGHRLLGTLYASVTFLCPALLGQCSPPA